MTTSFLSRYYWFGVRLGLAALARGQLKAGAKRLLNPVSFWRCVELPWAWDQLRDAPLDQVLDLGSPKQFGLYLATRTTAGRLVSTDILQDFVPEYRAFHAMAPGAVRPGMDYALLPVDGRAVPFRDGAFGTIFSISVIEHIPGEGDTAAMRELVRLLRPGGRLILTVPFAPEHWDEYLPGPVYERGAEAGGRTFYQRHYDPQTVRARLLEPAGIPVTRAVWFDGPDVWDGFLMKLPLPVRALLAPFQPLLVSPLVKPIGEGEARPGRYTLACYVLEKPAA